jgi:hypothetical protein
MFVFTEEVISNAGLRRYVTGGIYNGRYEGTSKYKKLYING